MVRNRPYAARGAYVCQFRFAPRLLTYNHRQDKEIMAESLSKGPAPPLFPDPSAVDAVVYDYLRRADRMGWSPYDLVDHEQVRTIARPERLNEVQRNAVKTVLFVEDHL